MPFFRAKSSKRQIMFVKWHFLVLGAIPMIPAYPSGAAYKGGFEWDSTKYLFVLALIDGRIWRSGRELLIHMLESPSGTRIHMFKGQTGYRTIVSSGIYRTLHMTHTHC